MNFRAFVRALSGRRPAARMLDGFVDSLLQMFENCRPGLADEGIRKEAEALGKMGGVPGTNVSTMDVNQMVNFLVGQGRPKSD